MNLYEVNKQGYNLMPTLTQDQIYDYVQMIRDFISKDKKSRVFMILCHDTRYYTLYEKKSSDEEWLEKLPYEIIDTVNSLGEIKSIELAKENNGIEFWIKPYGCDEPFLYLLFDWTNGVIEI